MALTLSSKPALADYSIQEPLVYSCRTKVCEKYSAGFNDLVVFIVLGLSSSKRNERPTRWWSERDVTA